MLTLTLTSLFNVLLAVGFTWFITNRNVQVSLDLMADNIMNTLRDETANLVQEFQEDVRLTAHALAVAMAADPPPEGLVPGHLDPVKLYEAMRILMDQSEVINLYVGNETGAFYMLGRASSVDPTLGMLWNETPGAGNQNRTTKHVSLQPSSSLYPDKDPFTWRIYDPRVRPWYNTTAKGGRAWSPIYPFAASGQLGITYAVTVGPPTTTQYGVPVAEDPTAGDGQLRRYPGLRAVIGADITLAELSSMLRRRTLLRSGQAFLVTANRGIDGILVAGKSNISQVDDQGNLRPVRAVDSDNPIIVATFRSLFSADASQRQQQQQQQPFSVGITDPGDYENGDRVISVDGQLHVVRARYVGGDQEPRLPWVLVITVPAAEFFGAVDQNNQASAAILGFTMVLAAAMSVLIGCMFARPLNRLNRAMQRLSVLDFSALVLIDSFNVKSSRLLSPIQRRQQQEQQDGHPVDNTPATATTTTNATIDRTPSAALLSSSGIYPLVAPSSAGPTSAGFKDNDDSTAGGVGMDAAAVAAHINLRRQPSARQRYGSLFTRRYSSSDLESSSATAASLMSEVEAQDQRIEDEAASSLIRESFPSFFSEIRSLKMAFGNLQAALLSFARFIPPEVVQRVVRGDPGADSLYVESKRCTILFSDIVGFTTITEQLHPLNLIVFLETYYNEMCLVIEEECGTIGDFIGDGIFAFWNSPEAVDAQASRAVRAALEMNKRLALVNARCRQKIGPNFPSIRIRVGIHTGQVLAGNIGSHTRMKFGLVGDAVNLASRLEGANKFYGSKVMISDQTLRTLLQELKDGVESRTTSASGDDTSGATAAAAESDPDSSEQPELFRAMQQVISQRHASGGWIDEAPVTRRLDVIAVAGKQQSTEVYEVLSSAHSSNMHRIAQLRRLARDYEKALDLFCRRKLKQAIRVLKPILERHPHDVASRLLLDRCQRAIDDPSKWSKINYYFEK